MGKNWSIFSQARVTSLAKIATLSPGVTIWARGLLSMGLLIAVAIALAKSVMGGYSLPSM